MLHRSLLSSKIAAILLLSAATLHAAELFVSTNGNDASEGTSLQKPLATIQKGVDLLQPGDTLTIAPGEYRQSAQRSNLGSMDHDTTIRTLIPGTVLLRGDVPISGFTKTPGMKLVHQIPFDQPVQVVNELDTLTVLRRVPNIQELEMAPGRFYHDTSKGILYISGSDWRAPSLGHYSATITSLDGLWFGNAQRLIIDGLSFTGFNSTMPDRYTPPYRSKYTGMGAVWGLFLSDSKSCVIRNCTAYLNGGGIGVEHLIEPKPAGQYPNTIERCTAYGTFSQLFTYETSAIGVYQANGDQIKDCTAYLNKSFGVRFYLIPFAPGSMDRCVAWGNYHDSDKADLQIKSSTAIKVTRSIATGYATVQSGGFNVVPEPQTVELPGNIVLKAAGKPPVDIEREFADPVNLDYRLQPNSIFRKAAPEGADAGIAPYSDDVYYVHPYGSDDADGHSSGTAWKTLGRAMKNRSPGDTVYLFPGNYSHPATITAKGTLEKPVSIRTRGMGTAVIEGNLSFASSNHLTLERISFSGQLNLNNSSNVTIMQSYFLGKDRGLKALQSPGLSLYHNTFTGSSVACVEADKSSNNIRCQGNLFDNRAGVGLSLAEAASVLYSDYNSYTTNDRTWSVASKPWLMTRVKEFGEVHSRQFTPDFAGSGSPLKLLNASLISVAGPLGKPIGCYRDTETATVPRVIENVLVHSVSATTANFEWLLNQSATCVLQWGTTPDCENADTIDVNRTGSFSLTGLSPNTTYYFRIKSTSPLRARDATTDPPVTVVNTKPVMIRTLAIDAPARTYYVSPDGSDEGPGTSPSQPWRSLSRAAAAVLPGDTVLIASGRYKERVRIRATGDANKPIKFACLPGHRVIIDGAGKSLANSFIITNKKHLHFDGFYLVNATMFPESGPFIELAGGFFVYRSADIRISRCYSDARGGYSATSVVAHRTERLTISNSVLIGDFAGPYIEKCPELRFEHCVFASPLVSAIVHRNARNESTMISSNIFVDTLNKKSIQNFGMLIVDGYTDSFRMDNNCFFIRHFTPADRKIINAQNITEAGILSANALFENPKFEGVEPLVKAGQARHAFEPDILVEAPKMLDFDAYFATNPAVIARGIGLQPEAFRDFGFSAAGSTQKQ